MSTEFKGLTAAVTGAGSGIGLATIKILADGGATVYGLDIAEGGIAEHGTWLQCDIGDDASVSAAFSKISKLDILINSAAISAVGTVESNPSEEWHKVMNVNVVGIVRTVREALPLLRKSDCASVTNVCSVAATAGIPKRALYSATKGAVLSLIIKEFKHPLLISPNDLTVLLNGSFYFSNDRNSPDITELLNNPKAGSVVFCDGNTSFKKADSAIAFPNGLYQENSKLYLATSRNFALFTYDIQPDGSLRNRKTLSSINGMDNLISNGDELIVAVHPDELKFALLSFLPNELSPCKIFSINKTTGAANIIFSDDGSLISGSSTAIVSGKDLYLSQVFDGFVLKIANYAD